MIIPHGDTIFRSGDHIVAYTRKRDAETLLRLQEFGGSGGFSRNAGYHRIFAEHRFFLHNWQGNELDLKIPPLDAGEYIAETAVAFAPRQLALILKIGQKKQVRPEIHTFTDQGEWVRQEQLAEDEWETAVLTYPYFRQQTPQGKLYQLPQGLLISNIHKLSIRYSK